jgi:GDPmannose 4,6-dehydratase
VEEHMKRAFITGISGQDGSYLAELLMNKGYEVHGLVRRTSSFNTQRISHKYKDFHSPEARIFLHFGDLRDSSQLVRILQEVRPDEIYNLASQSHVRVSFDASEETGDITGLGAVRLLEAMRLVCPDAKFFQASSSEMFGQSDEVHDEKSPFRPRSPYGAAKLYAHNVLSSYRDAYGLYIANGILFNHESPRRGETFVTRKITRAVAKIKSGLQTELYLGNMDATRDWGYAPDYVVGMWRSLQADNPQDYVFATNVEHSIRDFADFAFSSVGLNWHDFVRFDKIYLRPSEISSNRGDPKLAASSLGWKSSIQVSELADLMVEHDVKLIKGQVQDIPRSDLWDFECRNP